MSLNYRYECPISSFVADAVKFWTCNGSLLMPGGMIGQLGHVYYSVIGAPISQGILFGMFRWAVRGSTELQDV
ncbi:MAG: hypothetical protein Ct9H300mP19_11090 [Dehalococcoidia bacterium]|nr:MAG: hypothetical protein Ct9H300mP19_11090 [Dehalococcoidia bacterium]